MKSADGLKHGLDSDACLRMPLCDVQVVGVTLIHQALRDLFADG